MAKWTTTVGPHGARVRVGERTRGGNVYLWAWDPELGGNRKKSLKFKVRDADGKLISEAKKAAKKEASKLSNKLIRGEGPTRPEVTVRELFKSFRRDELPRMGKRHRAEVKRALEAWERYLGPRFALRSFGVREWRGFARARGSGAIDARGNRVTDAEKRREVGPRSVAKDLKVLRQACLYGTRVRTAQGFLLEVDPTRGLDLPSEPNPARPVADDDVLERILEAADRVRLPDGTRTPLRELVTLAAHTGRRIGAILAIRWSDWRPDRGTHGSLRWRADSDKLGREWWAPVHPVVAAALDAWRQERPGVGEAWIFPHPRTDGHLDGSQAYRWLRKAMELAEVPHVPGFGWHAFRRMWATKRKHLPVQDVAATGGWKGTQVLRDLYQQADPETMEAVILDDRPLRIGTIS